MAGLPGLAPAGAAEPGKLAIQLNRLEPQGASCRMDLVFSNSGPPILSSFKVEFVVFDRGGVIARRLAVEAGPLRPQKTTVKAYDVPDTACNAIGSILVNDVACRDAAAELPDCVDRVATSSKLDVTLTK